MQDDVTDPRRVVPKGGIVIGANYSQRTGDLNHTFLANDDLDPANLAKLVDAVNAQKLKITRVRFKKLRLPPKKEGDVVRSFRQRIVLHPAELRAESSFSDPLLTYQIIAVVLGPLLAQLAETGARAAARDAGAIDDLLDNFPPSPHEAR